ncbi:MAG TPA: HAD family phosphatase, partial [Candidatus Thermoplasmatota archaeon]
LRAPVRDPVLAGPFPHESMAVVLDFDGTIVQSMELHAQAYRRSLEPFGLTITDEEIFQREGARSETIIAEYLRKVGRDQPGLAKRVADEKQAIYKVIGPPKLYARAEAMVRTIREAAPKLGLVTGTRRENLDRSIPELVPLFDAVLSQESYTHDKPHPEPYEKTAAALGVPASRCAAVENAPRGIKSAKAAGYAFVVGIATTVARERLVEAGADAAYADHDQVAMAVVKWLGDADGLPSARRT